RQGARQPGRHQLPFRRQGGTLPRDPANRSRRLHARRASCRWSRPAAARGSLAPVHPPAAAPAARARRDEPLHPHLRLGERPAEQGPAPVRGDERAAFRRPRGRARAPLPAARNLRPGRALERDLADGSMQRVRAQPRALCRPAIRPQDRRGVRRATHQPHHDAGAAGAGPAAVAGLRTLLCGYTPPPGGSPISPTLVSTMSTASEQRLNISIEAFRAFYESRPDEEHWELIDGVPMIMAPATKAHQRNASNLERLRNDALERHNPTWAAYQRLGVNLRPVVDRYDPEPDVVVIDAEGGFNPRYVDRFYLAAAVVSDSDGTRVELKRDIYKSTRIAAAR